MKVELVREAVLRRIEGMKFGSTFKWGERHWLVGQVWGNKVRTICLEDGHDADVPFDLMVEPCPLKAVPDVDAKEKP